jgi:decaprenyl-phosphate phosphoribosyltransferase
LNQALSPRPPVDSLAAASHQSLWRGVMRTTRPKHWVKNLLVFAAPAAAGALGHPGVLARAGGAFVIFCVLASGIYFLNDAADASADRCHPIKNQRPVAAGVVPVRLAVLTGLGLVVAGLCASVSLGWRMLVVSGIYVIVQLAYSLWLKHEPVFDLACVAAGFVLRAIAGGVAVRLPISQWFLIVATFGSMMMVAGKRFAEHQQLGDRRGSHRPSLDSYSEPFLRGVMHLSAAVATTAYCLWAFEKQSQLNHHGDGVFFELSIVPFILAVLRYAFVVDSGLGGRPEDIVLSDRALQLVGAAWMALFALGVYVH